MVFTQCTWGICKYHGWTIKCPAIKAMINSETKTCWFFLNLKHILCMRLCQCKCSNGEKKCIWTCDVMCSFILCHGSLSKQTAHVTGRVVIIMDVLWGQNSMWVSASAIWQLQTVLYHYRCDCRGKYRCRDTPTPWVEHQMQGISFK